MEKIKLLKGNVNELKFGVSVSGMDVVVESMRLVVKEGDGYGYVIEAKEYKDGEAVFDFDKIVNKLVENKEYVGKMEVFINGQRFEPFECVFEVVEPVKVEVKESKVAEKKVSVEVKPVVVGDGEEVRSEKSKTGKFRFMGK